MRVFEREPGWLRRRVSSRQLRQLGLLALLVAAFVGGIEFERRGLLRDAEVALADKPTELRARIFSPVERVTLDLSHVNYQRLAFEREEALRRGVLVQDEDAYVSGDVRWRDQTLPARIRLKGDLADQFAGDHWAFRVKLKGEATLLGMKVFSLHQPSARNFLYEWVLHQMIQQEGLIGLRYEFVELVVNGRNLGIYALEEHFEKRLIEANGRPEGPILGISEEADIATIEHFGWPTDERVGYEGQPIRAFRERRTSEDPRLRRMYYTAHDLLAEFLVGSRSVDEVFDLEKTARYYAVLDLANGRHASKYGNQKFYYNPTTSRLEPICYDAEFVGLPVSSTYGDGIAAETWQASDDLLDISRHLFADPSFFGLYVAALERISTPDYLSRFFAERADEIERRVGILHRSYPAFQFASGSFFERATWIRRVLTRPEPIVAYPAPDADGARAFEVMNTSTLHLVVEGYRTGPTTVRASEPALVPALTRGAKPQLARLVLPAPPASDAEPFPATPGTPPAVELLYRVVGSASQRSIRVVDLPRLVDPERLNDITRMAHNVTTFDFIETLGSNAYRVRPGRWLLTTSLVLPRGASLEAGPGTELTLAPGAAMLARGPVRFRGSTEASIVVRGQGPGSGILLLGSPGVSTFEHVHFADLHPAEVGSLPLTGAVSAFESDVEFRYCVFSGAQAEDALNVVRSGFEISDSAFEDSAFDAFDADFSHGQISRSRFLRPGNDGIDVSGTMLTVSDLEILGAGDKAISAGERSAVRGATVTIVGGQIGVASKDQSEVLVHLLSLNGVRLGFAVFQKKPEYGPASIAVEIPRVSGLEKLYLLESPSSLFLDRRSVPPNVDRVEPHLYGAEFGKASSR